MRFNIFNQADIPQKYRSNFIHLYLDIAWFGVLSGTAVNFLNVYATHLGASGFQIGMLAAMSAVVNLFLAMPAGRWLEKRHTGKAIFWSSVVFRAGYALWIPLPWLFGAQGQIWALIVLAFLMAIPLTPLGVGFNALFAESVPEQYRAQVAGIRNITFAIAYVATSFIAGYILEITPFPAGYQIVFAIGTFGAALSSYHLYHVQPLEEARRAAPQPFDQTHVVPTPSREGKPDPAARSASSGGIKSLLRLDIWQTPFRGVMLVFLAFHVSHYLPAPIYQLYNVHVLHLNDSHIGNGTAFYYLAVLIGSTQFRNIAQRHGNKKTTGWGVMGMSFYLFALAAVSNVWQFYLFSFLGGFTWALANGAYANYLLENIPAHDRPAHLAWYNIILNVALLGSSLIGPAVADWLGLVAALIVFGAIRVLAGLAILKWG